MIYAQIKDNLVINAIVVDEHTPMDLFSAGYDYFLRIDNLDNRPGIGWSYDGSSFSPPIQIDEDEE